MTEPVPPDGSSAATGPVPPDGSSAATGPVPPDGSSAAAGAGDRQALAAAPLLVAAPPIVAALARLGASWPLTFELLVLASLAALAALAWRRRAVPRSWPELLLATAGVEGLLLSGLVGGRWAALHPGLEPPGRALSIVGALVAAAALGGLAALPARWRGTAPGVRRPPPLEVVLLLALAAQALVVALVCGAGWGLTPPGVQGAIRRLSAAAGLVAAAALATVAALPRLRAWWGEGALGLEPDRGLPASRVGPIAVALAWAVVHVPVPFAVPPLVQYDSWTNVLEPDLFVPYDHVFHHTPLYCELIKAACRAPVVMGLTAVVALQHALVLAIALLVERLLRRVGRDPAVAAVVGCGVAIEGTLVLYAQLVMSEVPGTLAALLAVACLTRTETATRAGPWVVAAGAGFALATLTRQVFQAWFVVGLVWLVWPARLRNRGRALAAFAAAALLPIAALVLHNWVFQGSAVLTAGAGRTFIPRVTAGMPDLTDPTAPPGDELERARAAVWRTQGRGWVAAHQALRAELGWDEERIGRAVRGFYLEQVRRRPFLFARVTLEHGWAMLSGADGFEGIIGFHDQIRGKALAGWDVLPPAGPPPRWLLVLGGLSWTHLVPALALAGLSPLLARGAARRLALLALATSVYVVAIPALVEDPLARYRLPATPFLALAAGLALAGARARLRASVAP